MPNRKFVTLVSDVDELLIKLGALCQQYQLELRGSNDHIIIRAKENPDTFKVTTISDIDNDKRRFHVSNAFPEIRK